MKTTALPLLALLAALPWLGSDSPRQRTARAEEAWEAERFDEARELLDGVLAEHPESPLARLNAGTARLAAGDPDGALDPLRAASEDPALAPDAYYDLGNARLASGYPEQAAELYREALRRDPDHGDAKHNLELALRRQREQRQQQEQEQPKGAEGDEGNEGDDAGTGTDSSGTERPGPRDEEQDERGEEGERDSRSSGQQGATGEPSSEDRRRPPSRLPGFENQEDMTAEQAAALLEAVENLEREQRRRMIREARERQARDRTEEKDW